MRAWLGVGVGVAVVCGPRAAEAVVPHRSMGTLSSSNGLGTLVWDATQYKITEFLEHPYQAASASTQSRNFAYDSYPGVRIGSTGTWLSTVAPSVVEYVPGTGIIHSQRTLQGLTLDEYDFAPMSLAQNASVMLLKVTGSASGPVDVYSLFNYQVGSGSPTPSNTGETLTYDATKGAYYETGGAGVAMAFAGISTPTYYGSSPNNPYGILMAGGNLQNDPGTSSPTTGAVAGFQTTLGNVALGQTYWVGWVTVLAPDGNGANAMATTRTWIAGRTEEQLLADEESGWASWLTPAPAGASGLEAALDQESQVILRMAQVTEPGAAYGQVLAAISPGEWNITWVRDMAYSTVALVKSGHYAEAKAALAFQMGATVGGYQSYLATTDGGAGLPYQISVCRYYGNGTEWSDYNSDGPNVEFDGFGLFLWALDEYVRASGDTATLTTWWPTIKSKVGDVLVALQEPSGVIAADSSIWEVHWDGQERHFAYTTAAAANGLCSAADLATKAGDSATASTYRTHGALARDAILTSMRGPNGSLGQSIEAIASGVKWLDASPIEVWNWGLLDATQPTAAATMSSMLGNLVPPSGEGFMRDQTGAYYDSQEWVFIDLRSERAFALAGNTSFSSGLFAWNVDQAADNFNELSELHDATTANYAGAAPMVGFGAGAYILGLTDRGTPVTPVCGAFAVEGPAGDAGGVDAGLDAGATSEAGTPDTGVTLHDAGTSKDAGHHPTDAGRVASNDDASVISRSTDADADANTGGATPASSGGCAITATPAPARDLWSFLPLLGLFLRRKRTTLVYRHARTR